MAITAITAPDTLTPCYNDLFFIVNSGNKNESGFRYIAQVYVDSTLVHTFKIAPQITTKYGKQNLSKFLASYLRYSHLFAGGNQTKGSFVDVDVKWGEEYSTNVWDFDDYGYAGSANWTNFSDPQYNQTGTPKTMLYVTTDVEPPFSAGDLIVVNQDSGTTPPFRPEIEGIQKVLDIEQVSSAPVEWMVVIDKPWIGSGIASTGSTDFADGSKSQTLDLLTQSCLVFNGSEPLISFGDWDADDWYMNHPNIGNFLTSMPRSGFRVRPDSKVFLQIYQDGADSVEFTSASGSNGSYSLTAPNAVEMIDASPSKLNTLDDYTVHIEDSSNNRISEQLSFTIDTACYGYEDLEICFLDRRGSILPFQFRLKRTQRQSVNRETYKHDITSDEMYDIDLLDAGQEDLHITEDITYTLRTAVMTLQEAIYLRELISSPFTVVRFGDGEYQRCEVLTRSIEIKDEYFEGARMEDIEIRLSNQDSVNW